MRPEHLEALSALFDGERVNPALLAEALADPGAADALADFAALSVLAREDRVEPSEAFYTRMETLLGRRDRRDRMARFVLPAVAAGLILASATTGYVVRTLLGPAEVIAVERPPVPFQPAPVEVTWSLPEVIPSALPPRSAGVERGAPPRNPSSGCGSSGGRTRPPVSCSVRSRG